MVIDEKFAKYILSLQSIAKLERGLDENYDIPFRDKLEDAFPNLKEKRESDEFENWLWSDKILNLPEIKTLVSTIKHFTERNINLIKSKHGLDLETTELNEDQIDQAQEFVDVETQKQERRIKELDAKKERYYNLFYDNIEIKKEYKLLKTIKKLSG